MIDRTEYLVVESLNCGNDNLYPCDCGCEYFSVAKIIKEEIVDLIGENVYTVVCSECSMHSPCIELKKPNLEPDFIFYMMEVWNDSTSKYIKRNNQIH